MRRDLLWLSVVTLGLYLPFLGRAFHIDDPLVLWTARQIAAHPADFYGFNVNWYGHAAPMAGVNQNPPGAAYYAALVGGWLGWSEPVMHGSVALGVVALVCGVYWLARTMSAAPKVAALIALFSPGIFVSGTTVMTDMPMTVLWVWALALWRRGLADRHPATSLASVGLIGLGTLTKFYAISLVPLLLMVTLGHGKKHLRRLPLLLIPVAMLALYEWYTRHLYGTGHFLASFSYAGDYRARHGLDVTRKVLSGLAFLGAGGAPALFLMPWLWRRRGRIAAAGLLVLCGAGAAVMARAGWQPGEIPVALPWWFWVQYAVWIAAGLHVLALFAMDARTQPGHDARLLSLWLAGTLVFSLFLYHFVNIRVLLPAFPAVALVCARRLRAREVAGQAAPRLAVAAALAASLALTLAVAWADRDLANAGRTAAERIAPEARGGPTWFSGHWGFQYYMQARGAKPIDQNHPDLQAGQTVVTPANATNRFPVDAHGHAADQSFDLPVCPWLTTMRVECGAGFYADVWGPLPFAFGPVPGEHYEVLLLGQ